MHGVLLAIIASSAPVPSPGRVLLQEPTSPVVLTRLLLAQHPDLEAEEDLSRDMQQARERLGHGDEAGDEQTQPEQVEQEQEQEEQPAEASEQEAVPAEEAAPVVEEDPYQDDPPPQRYRRRRRHRQESPGPEVLVAGHGKAHYLVWGIVDWVIAGGLWGGSLYAGVLTVLSGVYYLETRDKHFEHNRSDRQIAGVLFVLLGGVTLSLGGVGGLLAFNASKNVGTYREIVARQGQLRDSRGRRRGGWRL